MRKFISVVFIMGLLTMFSCSPSVTVKSDYDHDIDFSKFKTFKIYDGKRIPDSVLENSPLIKKRVENAAVEALKAKGFTEDNSDNADFIVVIHAGVKEKVQVTNWGSYVKRNLLFPKKRNLKFPSLVKKIMFWQRVPFFVSWLNGTIVPEFLWSLNSEVVCLKSPRQCLHPERDFPNPDKSYYWSE